MRTFSALPISSTMTSSRAVRTRLASALLTSARSETAVTSWDCVSANDFLLGNGCGAAIEAVRADERGHPTPSTVETRAGYDAIAATKIPTAARIPRPLSTAPAVACHGVLR